MQDHKVIRDKANRMSGVFPAMQGIVKHYDKYGTLSTKQINWVLSLNAAFKRYELLNFSKTEMHRDIEMMAYNECRKINEAEIEWLDEEYRDYQQYDFM